MWSLGNSMNNKEKVWEFIKYVKWKIKIFVKLSKIWFEKGCLGIIITPKYAKINLWNKSSVVEKLKINSEVMWVKNGNWSLI